MEEEKVDVLVSGAGPVGLLMTYQLRRLGISTCIIDAADKASPKFPMYGRACTLYPRTLEFLDQLDLWDEMAVQGWLGNRTMAWKDGKRIQNGGWTMSAGIRGTLFPFWLDLRLKYSEDIFRARVAKLGPKVQAPVKLVGLEVDDHAADDYKVTSTCATPEGRSFTIRSKYIIGCDGASSAVRRLAQIPFDGAETEDHWVRVDGVVKTNLPDARSAVGAISSATHGQVLWAPLDHGATRIGYVLSPALYAKYGRNMKQEDAVNEARAAIAPFELEFEKVDWNTVYTVKQFVAARFQDRERILLAGDSAHAHSSAAAQGMNTGVHDAVSLAWRLAGVINGTYKAEVLANYSSERREIAQHLIDNDKTISQLIANQKPEKYKDRTETTQQLFEEFQRDEALFSMGLGVHYPPNLLNDTSGSDSLCKILPGHYFPDTKVHKQGYQFGHSVRLHEGIKFDGKFHVLVFSGAPQATGAQLRKLRSDVDKDAPRFERVVDFRTVVYGAANAFGEYLGVDPFGLAYWDIDRGAHDRYNISLETGAIAVLRPDGILGYVAGLGEFDKVIGYLEKLVIPADVPLNINGTNGSLGEFVTPDETNLFYQDSNAQDIPRSHEEGAVKLEHASK